MADQDRAGEQAWLASVLPAQERLNEALGDDPVAALLGLARDRAPIEFSPVGDPGADPEIRRQFEVARGAAAALKRSPSTVLGPEEVRALHAFVHLLARPALRVVGGAIPAIPDSWERLKTAHDMVVKRIRGVGRVDAWNRTHAGTGWFIAADLLVTNRHVAAVLCGLDVHHDPGWLIKLPAAMNATNTLWSREPARRAVWDPAEAPSGQSAAVGSITKIRAVHEHLDLALLEVAGVANSADLVLRVHAAGPASPMKHDVYLAGYPAVTPPYGVSAQVAALLFPGASASGLKRVSPGQLVALVDDLPVGPNKPRESHDGSTLGGSSGSPVLDFANHRVVAIHYQGQYGSANHAVPLWLVKDDPLFTDNGITFAS